jgi:hypothetical protein
MIKHLEAEVGYAERSGGNTKFGDWYSKNVDHSYDFSNAAWCDMFLAWGAQKAGIADKVGQFAYTPSHAAWFKKNKAFDTHPAPGALVFYDWSGGKGIGGIDHVGIVTAVKGGKIHTIEGNVDGRFVKEKVRGQDSVVGYGHPEKIKTAPAKAAAPASKAPAAPSQAAQAPSPAADAGKGMAAMAYTRPAPSETVPAELLSACGIAVFLAISLLVFFRTRHRFRPQSAPGGRHRALGAEEEVRGNA